MLFGVGVLEQTSEIYIEVIVLFPTIRSKNPPRWVNI